MKKPKKRNISEESYWKTSTDIMAGVLLVILLVLMLLLLYLTQMKKEDYTGNDRDKGNSTYSGYETQPTTMTGNHNYDGQYTTPTQPRKNGSSGGGGETTPVVTIPEFHNPDEGHDKTAVLVSVVDEETKNVIKKSGILFELYASKDTTGGLQKLHTYYPEKIEYKQYKTTEDGTFYLPEKIKSGWYSFHNLVAPPGYGLAEDFNFEITESLDWPEPYLVKIPMSPSKNKIYLNNIDKTTKKQVGNETYEVYAAEDIVTLDGTVRYKSGQKVDTIKCNGQGTGSSKMLYLGKYYLLQKGADQFYALHQEQIPVQIKLTDTEKKNAITIENEKTRFAVTLKDEYSGEAIKDAVYSITDKGKLTTSDNGSILITDLEKDKTYNVKLESVPEPYRISNADLSFTVDKQGYISGKVNGASEQTAYMLRLYVDIKDVIFKNSVSSTGFTLYDSNQKVVDEWDAVGEAHIVEGLKPGTYTLKQDNQSSGVTITMKDQGGLHKYESTVWTLWDTILTITAVVALGLIVFLIVRIIRVRRKKKANENKEIHS